VTAERELDTHEEYYDQLLYEEANISSRIRILNNPHLEIILKSLGDIELPDIHSDSYEEVRDLCRLKAASVDKAFTELGHCDGTVIRKVAAVIQKAKLSKKPAAARRGLEQINRELKQLTEDKVSTDGQMEETLKLIEKWQSRKEEAPERLRMLKEREDQWMFSNREKNLEALRTMRALIPLNISTLSIREMRSEVMQRGGFYPTSLIMYLKESKLLHWLTMHQSQIQRSNFLAGTDAHHFSSLERYDLIELRAIVAIVENIQFEFDHDGQKSAWRSIFLTHVKLLISKGNGETVRGGWDPVKGTRARVKLSPLDRNQVRLPIYFYLNDEEAQKMCDKYTGRTKRVEDLGREVERAKKKLDETHAEYAAILNDSRNDQLRLRYGRVKLQSFKDLVKEQLENEKRLHKKALEALRSAELAILKAVPDESTFRQDIEMSEMLLSECECPVDKARRPIRGVFIYEEIPEPTVIIAKKLSAEEEALQRKEELKHALSARNKECNEPSVESDFREVDMPSSSNGMVRSKSAVFVSDSVRQCIEGQNSARKSAIGISKGTMLINSRQLRKDQCEKVKVLAKPQSKFLQKLAKGHESENPEDDYLSKTSSSSNKALSFLDELKAKKNPKDSGNKKETSFLDELIAKRKPNSAGEAKKMTPFLDELIAKSNFTQLSGMLPTDSTEDIKLDFTSRIEGAH